MKTRLLVSTPFPHIKSQVQKIIASVSSTITFVLLSAEYNEATRRSLPFQLTNTTLLADFRDDRSTEWIHRECCAKVCLEHFTADGTQAVRVKQSEQR